MLQGSVREEILINGWRIDTNKQKESNPNQVKGIKLGGKR